MTAKDFFQSNVFKSLAVLMMLVIICGGIIAVCNGLFYVSPEEETMRAVSKIFGSTPEDMLELTVTNEQRTASGNSTVNQAFRIIDNGDTFLLVKTTGSGGYKGGTITLWTVVTVADCTLNEDNILLSSDAVGIANVKYENNTSQTLMANFKSAYYEQLTNHNDIVAARGYFTTQAVSGKITDIKDGETVSPQTGASESSVAIINAVNAALRYAYTEAVNE